MTINEFIEVLELKAMNSIGRFHNVDFCIAQQGPFNDTKGEMHETRFMAYVCGERPLKPLFCNTVDELLDLFVIENRHLRDFLSEIQTFYASKCL